MSVKKYLLKLFRGWLPKEANMIRIRQFKPKTLLLLAASVLIASILLLSFWQVIFPPPISTSPMSLVPSTGTTQYPWPMFRHDPRHTGYTESPAPKTNKTLWTHATRGLRSSPAVADGLVYVGGGKEIYAMNATTGALIWIHETEGNVYSSPAVADGVVYVNSWDGRLYAFGELPPLYIVIKSVKASPTTVMAGLPVSITVVVENEGNETETFNIAPYYTYYPKDLPPTTIIIGTKTVTNLAPGASETLTFTSGTMGLAKGMPRGPLVGGTRYIDIKVVASTLTGEPINTLICGRVTISFLPLYVAAGIAIVTVVAIVVYFVKVRKRE